MCSLVILPGASLFIFFTKESGHLVLLAYRHLSEKMEGFLYSLLICTVTRSKLLLVYKYIYFPAPLNKAASLKSRRHRAKVLVYKHPCDAKWTDPPTTGRCRRSRPLNSQSPGFQIGKQQRAADSRWPLLHTSYLPQNEQPQEEKMPRG